MSAVSGASKSQQPIAQDAERQAKAARLPGKRPPRGGSPLLQYRRSPTSRCPCTAPGFEAYSAARVDAHLHTVRASNPSRHGSADSVECVPWLARFSLIQCSLVHTSGRATRRPLGAAVVQHAHNAPGPAQELTLQVLLWRVFAARSRGRTCPVRSVRQSQRLPRDRQWRFSGRRLSRRRAATSGTVKRPWAATTTRSSSSSDAQVRPLRIFRDEAGAAGLSIQPAPRRRGPHGARHRGRGFGVGEEDLAPWTWPSLPRRATEPRASQELVERIPSSGSSTVRTHHPLLQARPRRPYSGGGGLNLLHRRGHLEVHELRPISAVAAWIDNTPAAVRARRARRVLSRRICFLLRRRRHLAFQQRGRPPGTMFRLPVRVHLLRGLAGVSMKLTRALARQSASRLSEAVSSSGPPRSPIT